MGLYFYNTTISHAFKSVNSSSTFENAAKFFFCVFLDDLGKTISCTLKKHLSSAHLKCTVEVQARYMSGFFRVFVYSFFVLLKSS